MIKDLMQLYNLRPAFGQATIIFAQAILQTYLSGIAEETTESVMDYIADSSGALVGSLSKVLEKASEGGLNAMLILRLGKRTISALKFIE